MCLDSFSKIRSLWAHSDTPSIVLSWTGLQCNIGRISGRGGNAFSRQWGQLKDKASWSKLIWQPVLCSDLQTFRDTNCRVSCRQRALSDCYIVVWSERCLKIVKKNLRTRSPTLILWIQTPLCLCGAVVPLSPQTEAFLAKGALFPYCFCKKKKALHLQWGRACAFHWDKDTALSMIFGV